MLKRFLLYSLAGISILLLWITISNYRNTQSHADEMLFGIAHSLHAAIEFSVHQDASLRSLSKFHSHDLIYFALVDNEGIYQFHSKTELIGTLLQDKNVLKKMSAEEMTGKRVRLATGEDAYELFTHVQVPKGTLGVQLILHTNRADEVIRSARITMAIMVALLVFSWLLTVLIYRYARREEQHRLELSQQQHLAKMGEMGAMLAHEIRNPLAGIKGFAQLIEKKPESPRTRDSAQRIIVETLRLEELTTDLLAFARSDELPVSIIQVDDFVEQAIALLHPEAEQLCVTITTDCQQGLEVRGHRDRLTQVILNIVKNGLQAMPDGGTLTITTKLSGSDVSILVADTGHGISPDVMQSVFEPFFTTKARGTGLGLALCKKILEEHNGSIKIESSGVGTTATMVLPVTWRKDEV